MATNTTIWRPDTCPDPPCEVAYTWDDAAPGIHAIAGVTHRCILHSTVPDPVAHLTALDTDCALKNDLISLLISQFPTAVRRDADGNFAGFVVPVHRFFSQSRVLILAIPALTGAQITSLQTLVDTTFGAGRIRVLSGIALQLLAELISRFPALARLGGDGLVNFRDLVEWTVSAGVITLTIQVLTIAQKTSLQNWCDTNLGVGKVIVA